jgi:hypothetical protein
MRGRGSQELRPPVCYQRYGLPDLGVYTRRFEPLCQVQGPPGRRESAQRLQRPFRVCLTNTKRGQIDSRESRFSVFACDQRATLRGSGALNMVVDGTEKTLCQNEPSLTSPSLLYEAKITPLGDTFESVSVKAAGMVPSPNSRLPLPRVTGNTFNHNSSTKSFANKV